MDETNLGIDPIHPLDRDLRKAAESLKPSEARLMVDYYYLIQKQRVRANNQIRAMEQEPHDLINWVHDNTSVIEKNIKVSLEVYALSHEVGRWSMAVHGIGPVISAGLIAHVDIEKSTSISKLWSFAGQNPTAVWKKGTKRPWNARLKVICFHIGQCLKRTHNSEKSFYGPIYAERKALEEKRNLDGKFADQARGALSSRNIGKSTEAYKWYKKGMLPPGRLDRRACRYATKLFLCHSSDTLIWTDCGPISVEDVTERTKLATMNPSSNELVYEAPANIYDYDYTGDMVAFKGTGYDFVVTPKHQMWVRPIKPLPTGTWRFVTAEDFALGSRSWSNTGPGHGILRPEAWDMQCGGALWNEGRAEGQPPFGDWPTWCEFLGWFLSEGSAYKSPDHAGGYNIALYQKDEAVRQEFKEIFTKLGLRWYDTTLGVGVSSKALYEELHPLGRSWEKYIPDEIKALPKVYLEILIRCLFRGDGWIDTEGRLRRYYTTSERLAHDVMEVGIKLGYGTRVRCILGSRIKAWAKPEALIQCDAPKDLYTVTYFSLQSTPRVNRPSFVPYSGTVHCFNVGGKLLLTGRGGRYCWSGNSHWWQVLYQITYKKEPPSPWILTQEPHARIVPIPMWPMK